VPFWRKTTKGTVLNRWLPAGISKLMPVLFVYGCRILKKTSKNLQHAGFRWMIDYCRNSQMIINLPNHTLIPCLKSYCEIVLFPPETVFFIPSEIAIKSIILRKWQRFD